MRVDALGPTDLPCPMAGDRSLLQDGVLACSSVTCSFPTGHRGALPGAGSGEEKRGDRTQPGTVATRSSSLAVRACSAASPGPGAAGYLQPPEVEKKHFCAGELPSEPLWAGKQSPDKKRSGRLLI